MAKPARRRAQYLPPRDHLAAIGAVAASWTAIEALMETTILGLYEIDLGRGLVLTNNLSFPAKMSLLRILTSEGAISDPVLVEKMQGIFTRVDNAYGERNAIVHGLWGPTDKVGVVKRLSIRAHGKKLQTISENYSATDLWKIADRLAEIAKDLADLGNDLGIEDRLASAPRHSSITIQ